MLNIPCVIFAGGKSSRMGVDKALLPFGGFDTLTQFQLSKFTPYFLDVYISSKSKDKFDFEANFIEDLKTYEDSAPHIGLISAFETLKCDAICVLSVDTPFFDIKHFEKLYNYLETHDGVVAKSPNNNQPLCAIYRKSILPTLLKLTKDKRYRFAHLFEKIDVKFVEFEDEEIFTNLNTPEDYKATSKAYQN
jgi:molybdopterin-guanine dinucleotide biosynthesis protein A